jgi:predicted DNA-binding transcriptional regulator YafY
MKRTERLFAIAEALRGRRTGITAELLADRFGVSVRTIYRDLDSLREASLPLHSERGRGGGYALDRTYALPPVNFTAREAALLLVLGRFATEMRVLPFTTALQSALDKVRGALPDATQRKLEVLMKTVSFVGVPAHTSDPDVRRSVENAFFDRLALRVWYRRKEYESPISRTVKIQSVVLERGETRLNCIDLERNEPRQLRLHTLERAEVIEVRDANAASPHDGNGAMRTSPQTRAKGKRASIGGGRGRNRRLGRS